MPWWIPLTAAVLAAVPVAAAQFTLRAWGYDLTFGSIGVSVAVWCFGFVIFVAVIGTVKGEFEV